MQKGPVRIGLFLFLPGLFFCFFSERRNVMSEKTCTTLPVAPKATRSILENKKRGLAMTVQSETPSPTTSQATFTSEQPIKSLVMNDVDAAAYLGMSPNTLRKWRTTGRGPAYIRCGRLKKYRLADLEAYIEKQMVAR
jgi:hypothetical protein